MYTYIGSGQWLRPTGLVDAICKTEGMISALDSEGRNKKFHTFNQVSSHKNKLENFHC
jgi:hypothetical protein